MIFMCPDFISKIIVSFISKYDKEVITVCESVKCIKGIILFMDQ